jgi:hypothetical protein
MIFENSSGDFKEEIHLQRIVLASLSKEPTMLDVCQRCERTNNHAQLYKCYGCDVVYCMGCTSIDPVFVFEYGGYTATFCGWLCKHKYMTKHHKLMKDCDECHVICPSYDCEEKICSECMNGVCRRCKKRIEEGKVKHSHLDWD